MNEETGEIRELSLDRLPPEERQRFEDIFAGKLLPPLYSDVIAKAIFNADVHPERLNFLLRGIAKDDTIEVRSSAANEMIHPSVHSKGIITDLPSWLKDGRLADVEMQKARQDFIFSRMEVYTSEMLLLQYSIEEGQSKGKLSYNNVKSALMVVLMVESPKVFQGFDMESERYIHRFTKMRADSGLAYSMKAKTIYVQLDKCLKQFREGKNAEAEDGRPDGLQSWLAMIADANDEKVKEAAKNDETMRRMQKEMYNMVQDKEVRNMIMQEKFDRMDWITYGSDQKEEGREEGREEAREEDRKASEEKDRRRVWKMHEDGISVSRIAKNMEIGIDTVQKWLDGSKPAYV